MPNLANPSNQPKYVSKRSTANRYGKTPRTIMRWIGNPDLGFPQPAIINGRWYFEKAELDAFDHRLANERLSDLAQRHQAEAKVRRTHSEEGVRRTHSPIGSVT